MRMLKIYHFLRVESENNPTQLVWSVIIASCIVFFLGFIAIQGFDAGRALVRAY